MEHLLACKKWPRLLGSLKLKLHKAQKGAGLAFSFGEASIGRSYSMFLPDPLVSTVQRTSCASDAAEEGGSTSITESIADRVRQHALSINARVSCRKLRQLMAAIFDEAHGSFCDGDMEIALDGFAHCIALDDYTGKKDRSFTNALTYNIGAGLHFLGEFEAATEWYERSLEGLQSEAGFLYSIFFGEETSVREALVSSRLDEAVRGLLPGRGHHLGASSPSGNGTVDSSASVKSPSVSLSIRSDDDDDDDDDEYADDDDDDDDDDDHTSSAKSAEDDDPDEASAGEEAGDETAVAARAADRAARRASVRLPPSTRLPAPLPDDSTTSQLASQPKLKPSTTTSSDSSSSSSSSSGRSSGSGGGHKPRKSPALQPSAKAPGPRGSKAPQPRAKGQGGHGGRPAHRPDARRTVAPVSSASAPTSPVANTASALASASLLGWVRASLLRWLWKEPTHSAVPTQPVWPEHAGYDDEYDAEAGGSPSTFKTRGRRGGAAHVGGSALSDFEIEARGYGLNYSSSRRGGADDVIAVPADSVEVFRNSFRTGDATDDEASLDEALPPRAAATGHGGDDDEATGGVSDGDSIGEAPKAKRGTDGAEAEVEGEESEEARPKTHAEALAEMHWFMRIFAPSEFQLEMAAAAHRQGYVYRAHSTFGGGIGGGIGSMSMYGGYGF